MTTIFYSSNTGTTRRYAELLSEKTGCPCLPLDKWESAETDDAVFLGWVFGGDIQGLNQMKETGLPLRAVGAVGIMAQDKDAVREKNCPDLPFCFLPGAFDLKKLKGMYKLMAGMIVKVIRSKLKEAPSEESEKILGFFENGIDLFSEDALAPLVEMLTA